MQVVDAIYLNKRGNRSNTSVWAYYRITSQGELGDHIKPCMLEWRSFKDSDFIGDVQRAVVVNPGDTGYAVAYPHLSTLSKNKWKVDHSDDEIIGLRVREV